MKGKGKKKEEIEAETSKGPAVIQTVPDFIVMGSPASGFFFSSSFSKQAHRQLLRMIPYWEEAN